MSYSGDALRSFNVQPTSQLRRDVRKRLFSLRIWSPRYKHVNKGNSNVKLSFDHSVTVRKSVPGVKLGTVMCNGLPRTTLSYSGDALRSFNVQPTSQLRRDVRKRLFSLRIWSPRYKHVNKGNSNVKLSFDHSVTVRKSVPGVKLGVINCQSISGKLDFVFDHIKEYQWTLWR